MTAEARAASLLAVRALDAMWTVSSCLRRLSNGATPLRRQPFANQTPLRSLNASGRFMAIPSVVSAEVISHVASDRKACIRCFHRWTQLFPPSCRRIWAPPPGLRRHDCLDRRD